VKRRVRRWLKGLLLIVHKLCLRIGVSVLPNHFYSSVPDINELAATKSLWAHKSLLPGVTGNIEEQVCNLREICLPYEAEYRGNRAYQTGTQEGWGPGFGYLEAQALHGVVRHFKPRKIVEVGSGVSTHCMLQAVTLNDADDKAPCEIICIEPYPSHWLKQAHVHLIAQKVQTIPLDLFLSLEPNDLLFIDSSHAVKTGSDVVFLVLEVLPRLRPGVLVHIHDVYLPFDYAPNKMYSLFDWQETALIHAFLIGNSGVHILFCLSQLHDGRPEVLRQVFPEYRPAHLYDGLIALNDKTIEDEAAHFPASLFLQIRVRD
jgi:hypothetical protein